MNTHIHSYSLALQTSLIPFIYRKFFENFPKILSLSNDFSEIVLEFLKFFHLLYHLLVLF